MTSGMPGGHNAVNAPGHARITVEKLKLALFEKRRKIIVKVSSAGPNIGMAGLRPFDTLNPVFRPRECRLSFPINQPCVPSAVIRMQMRINDDVNILWRSSQISEILKQPTRLSLEPPI